MLTKFPRALHTSVWPSGHFSRQALKARTFNLRFCGSNGSKLSETSPQWDIKMLYDGDCPLCMREVDMLKKRDKGVNKIAFVDISSEFYTPENNGGVSYEAAMERIHALLPDGTIVKDVEVFRRLYDAVGLGWVYAVTKNRTIEALANSVYDIWAKYRLPLTGRDWEIVMAKKIACGIDSAEECKIK